MMGKVELSEREKRSFLHARYMSVMFDMAKEGFRPIYQDVEEDFVLMLRTGFFCAVDATTDKLVLNTVSRDFTDEFTCYDFSTLHSYLFDNPNFHLRDSNHPLKIEDIPLLSIREFNDILPEQDFETYFSLTPFEAGLIFYYNTQGCFPRGRDSGIFSTSAIQNMNDEYHAYRLSSINEQARHKKIVRFRGVPDFVKKDLDCSMGKMPKKHF